VIDTDNILNNNMLFCIGNSHIHQFSGFPHGQLQFNVLKGSIVVNIGPVLAYNFSTKHIARVYDLINRFNFNVNRDILLICVGEIDCRWHILNQAETQKRSYQDITRECAWRYFNTMLNLARNINDIKVIVWGVPPATRLNHKDDDMSAPIYGDVSSRTNVIKTFNSELSKLCSITRKIKFASIYDDLLDSDGFANSDLFSLNDYIHYDHVKIVNFVNKELNRVVCEF